MTVSKYRLKNKEVRYECRYYAADKDGSMVLKHKSGFRTSDAAKAWELAHKGNSPVGTSQKFSEMFEAMSQANRANDTTTVTRRQRMKRYAEKLWNKPMVKLTKPYIQQWREDLGKTDLATATKNDIIGYVKQVGRFAWENYDIPDNTKVLKSFPKTVEDFHEMAIINYDQFKKLMENEENEILLAYFQLLFMTGCRKGEARALLKEDFDGKQIHIYKSMRRYEDSIRPTKTSIQRWVPLDDATIRMLQPLMKRKGKYLFGDYAPLCLTTIDKHFKANLKAADLPPMRIHDLRHSHVSMLWAAGVPVPEISKRIGHSSPKVTMEVYAHIFDNAQSASLNFLNALEKSQK
ncbi:MAG: site-specific integrase [Solobacterium sp.]|nr:site-specific integrase [Solobacterium sp.]